MNKVGTVRRSEISVIKSKVYEKKVRYVWEKVRSVRKNDKCDKNWEAKELEVGEKVIYLRRSER